MPSFPEVHIPRAITNLLPAVSNKQYIADAVAPVVPVNKIQDKIFTFTRDTFIRASGLLGNGAPASYRGTNGESTTVDFDVSNQLFTCTEMVRKILVNNIIRESADTPLDVFVAATKKVRDTIMLDNEIQVAQLATNPANYASTSINQLQANKTNGTSWSNYESSLSNPLINIKQGKKAVKQGLFTNANTLLISYGLSYTLQDHPLYKDLYKYMANEGMTNDGLAKSIRGLTTIEGSTFAATNPYGQSATATNVWAAPPDSSYTENEAREFALVYYRNSENTLYEPQTFKTFEAPNPNFRKADGPNASTGGKSIENMDGNGRGFSIQVWRDIAKAGTYIECSTYRDWQCVTVDGNGMNVGAYLITDVPDDSPLAG